MKLHDLAASWDPPDRRAKPGCLRLDIGQTTPSMYPFYAIFSDDGRVVGEYIGNHSKRAWAKIEKRGRKRLATEQNIRRRRAHIGLEEVVIDHESYANAELQS